MNKYKIQTIVKILSSIIILICCAVLISLAKKDKNSISNDLVNAKYELSLTKLKLEKQIGITDSLLYITNLAYYDIKHDTLVISNIKIKYEKEKVANRELTPNEQLRFSSRWLSKEDSLAN